MTAHDHPIIDLQDVHFRYREAAGQGFALDVPDLTIQPGEHAACIGPSGSGKTTLINLIAGIFVPDRGRVDLNGRTISTLEDTARRAERIRTIGLVFQEFELLEYLTALDNILLPYHVSSSLALTSGVRDRALTIARMMRIEHVLSRNPRRLSQGERQRVAICRAVVTGPKLIIADEPTGNLDPETADITLDLLFEQVKAHDATLLIVTHNHGVLDRFERTIDMLELVRGQSPDPAVEGR